MTGYITVKRAAEEQGVSRRRISHLLVQGRIQGAVKFGHQWAIPLPVVVLPPSALDQSVDILEFPTDALRVGAQ